MSKLQGSAVWKEAYSFTFHNLSDLRKILLFPSLILIGIYYLSSFFLKEDIVIFKNDFLGDFKLSSEALMLVSYLFVPALWVPQWIQFYADPKKKPRAFSFNESNLKFLGCFLFYGAIIMGVIVIMFTVHDLL